jgi:hypothetical protein
MFPDINRCVRQQPGGRKESGAASEFCPRWRGDRESRGCGGHQAARSHIPVAPFTSNHYADFGFQFCGKPNEPRSAGQRTAIGTRVLTRPH